MPTAHSGKGWIKIQNRCVQHRVGHTDQWLLPLCLWELILSKMPSNAFEFRTIWSVQGLFLHPCLLIMPSGIRGATRSPNQGDIVSSRVLFIKLVWTASTLRQSPPPPRLSLCLDFRLIWEPFVQAHNYLVTQEPTSITRGARQDQQAPWTTCSKSFPVWAVTSQGWKYELR